MGFLARCGDVHCCTQCIHVVVLATAETRHRLTSWYAQGEGVVSMLSSIENAFCSVGGERGEQEDNRLFGTMWRHALLHTLHAC